RGGPASKSSVQCVCIGYYITFGIDDCEMSSLGRLVTRGVAGADLRAGRRVCEVDRLGELRRVLLRRETGHRNLYKVRVTHELGAIGEGPALGFDDQVQSIGRSRRHLAKLVVLEDVEHLEKRGAAR